MRRFARLARPVCLGLTAAALAGAVAGCSAAGLAWLTAALAPPKKVPAQYKPPQDKTLLVFVCDKDNPVDYEPIKGELTDRLNEQLAANRVAARTIPYQRLAELASATPEFNALSVSDVGRKLGADLVLYVRIDGFALKDSAASELWRGQLQVSVRIVEVGKGRLWPLDRPGGHPIPAVETSTATESSPLYASELARTLATRMADRVAKLFYDHTEPHEGTWGPSAESSAIKG